MSTWPNMSTPRHHPEAQLPLTALGTALRAAPKLLKRYETEGCRRDLDHQPGKVGVFLDPWSCHLVINHLINCRFVREMAHLKHNMNSISPCIFMEQYFSEWAHILFVLLFDSIVGGCNTQKNFAMPEHMQERIRNVLLV